MSLTVNAQTTDVVGVDHHHDVLVAVAVNVGHVIPQVGRADVAALIGIDALTKATERNTIEHGNLVAHVHHDFLHAVARLVLDATEVEGTGEVLSPEIPDKVVVIYHPFEFVFSVESRHSP